MSRARAAGLSLALALLGAPAARGQEGPAPPPAAPPGPTIGLLGEVLRRAQEGGAIERLAGERWFRLQGKQGGDALLLVRVIPSAEPPRVVVDTVLTTLGQDPPADMNTQVLLGPDGRMQAFRSALRLAGRGESRAEGRVQQGELQLVVEQPGQDRREERKPWEADAVPGQALMFLVPALWEFIPQDELQLVQFDESAGKLAPWLLQRARSDPAAQGPQLVTVRLVHPVERERVQFEARVDPRGRIVEVRREQATLRAVEDAEAQRLLGAERARLAAGAGVDPASGPAPVPPPPAPR